MATISRKVFFFAEQLRASSPNLRKCSETFGNARKHSEMLCNLRRVFFKDTAVPTTPAYTSTFFYTKPVEPIRYLSTLTFSYIHAPSIIHSYICNLHQPLSHFPFANLTRHSPLLSRPFLPTISHFSFVNLTRHLLNLLLSNHTSATSPPPTTTATTTSNVILSEMLFE